MNRLLALDTSVAVPLLVDTHPEHALVVGWRDGRDVVLCGHAAVETFSVLTRLPRDARLSPGDAARLIGARFGPALPLGVETFRVLPDLLAGRGVQGGAVYDALVGLAAVEHGADLAPRDVRARGTYEAVGTQVVMIG